MFCPNCRSEYRTEFKSCKACGGVALIENLPEFLPDLEDAAIATSQPVGFTQSGSDRTVEVDGRVIDPFRVFDLDTASKVKLLLAEQMVASVIVPLEHVMFPDGRPRFEVRVREGGQAGAEKILLDHWRESVEREGFGAEDSDDVEKCPACGAHVPLADEECPECGLGIGSAAERSAPSEM